MIGMIKNKYSFAACLCICVSLLCVACNSTGESEYANELDSISESDEVETTVGSALAGLEPLDQLGMSAEQVVVDIEGVTEPYTFLFLSDLHVVNQSEEVKEKEAVDGRIAMYTGWNGKTSTDNWKMITESLKQCEIDGVLLGGDMVDFASTSNLTALHEGLEKLKVPYMYVRADHDTEPFYCEPSIKEKSNSLHESMDGNEAVFLWEYDTFCVVGMSFSTSQLTSAAVERFEEIYKIGKPIILMIHVPLNSLVDESLDVASREVWADRNLTWGNGCHYYPDENTSRFLEFVYEEDTLVKEVLGGHLHFTWDGQITDDVHQHVFRPACDGYYGLLKVE